MKTHLGAKVAFWVGVSLFYERRIYFEFIASALDNTFYVTGLNNPQLIFHDGPVGGGGGDKKKNPPLIAGYDMNNHVKKNKRKKYKPGIDCNMTKKVKFTK